MKAYRLDFNTKEKAEKVIFALSKAKRRVRWWMTYNHDKAVYMVFYEPMQ